MPTGWEFQSFDPQHPTTAFGGFVKECKRDIAGGLNVAYNNFANDLEGVSYSSIRSGTVEEREQWKVKQDQFARIFPHAVWVAWLNARTLDKDPVPSDVADEYSNRDVWTGRRWPWVDPQSDIAARKEEIALGLTAPSIIADEMSSDYAEVQDRLKSDNDMRAANGLQPISAQTGTAAQDTALNGAQMASLVQILTSAASGAIPKESVPAILAASFPNLEESQIAAIVAPLNAFTPSAPKQG
jgi:capsid protein